MIEFNVNRDLWFNVNRQLLLNLVLTGNKIKLKLHILLFLLMFEIFDFIKFRFVLYNISSVFLANINMS